MQIPILQNYDEEPLSVLGLGTRAENALNSNGIYTIPHLLEYSESKLMRLPNVGRVSVGEIKAKLEERMKRRLATHCPTCGRKL